MAFSGPIEDRFAIRELHDSYSDSATRHDREAWLACWADDGEWRIMHGDFISKEEIGLEWDRIMNDMNGGLKGADLELFLSFPASMELHGDHGVGYVYTNELVVNESGRVSRLAGRYDDEYVKVDGHWLFKSRTYHLIHVDSHVER